MVPLWYRYGTVMVLTLGKRYRYYAGKKGSTSGNHEHDIGTKGGTLVVNKLSQNILTRNERRHV